MHAAALARLACLLIDRIPNSAPLSHRHLLARSATTLYVAFMGSKHPRDYLADANLLTRLLWSEAAPAGRSASGGSEAPGPRDAGSGSDAGTSTAAGPAAAGAPAEAAASAAAPAVHRGFLSRAEGVLIEALWAHAQRQGLRLVLCG